MAGTRIAAFSAICTKRSQSPGSSLALKSAGTASNVDAPAVNGAALRSYPPISRPWPSCR